MANSLAILALSLVMVCIPLAVESETPFANAVPGRVLLFPADHGKHPGFQTEWWYFTGNLESDSGRKWGFQVTFFRRGLSGGPAGKGSSWRARDLYPGHFALTDIENRKFFHTDMICREGPGLAGAASDRLRVWIKDWAAEQEGEKIRVKARKDGYALDITLVPTKPLVLHGNEGYSRKGDNEQQASYYYSFTRLKASGSITFASRDHSVSGLAWMDHEFGSSILSKDQAGWDWFSLQMEDGTELMAFHLRKKDGTFERSFGTFVGTDGAPVNLSGEEVLIRSTRTWTSSRTKAVYPSGWILEVPARNIKLEVRPLLDDQEVSAEKSTGVIYWEGAVSVKGTVNGKDRTGKGYVELTGYAHSMEGRI